jgi:hypothetical protein
MYKLTLVDCWTDIVAGFSPLRVKDVWLDPPWHLAGLAIEKSAALCTPDSPVHI